MTCRSWKWWESEISSSPRSKSPGLNPGSSFGWVYRHAPLTWLFEITWYSSTVAILDAVQGWVPLTVPKTFRYHVIFLLYKVTELTYMIACGTACNYYHKHQYVSYTHIYCMSCIPYLKAKTLGRGQAGIVAIWNVFVLHRGKAKMFFSSTIILAVSLAIAFIAAKIMNWIKSSICTHILSSIIIEILTTKSYKSL